MAQATELEEYARAAEFSCASIIDLLSPIFASYNVDEIPLPKPVPLTAYPMDGFQASDETFVLQAQEKISEKVEAWKVNKKVDKVDKKGHLEFEGEDPLSDDSNDSSDSDSDCDGDSDSDSREQAYEDELRSQDCANECIRIMFNAVQKQHDVELMARVGRKNVQVMDRLAKMSTHKEKMLRALTSSTSLEAMKQGELLGGGEIPVYWCRVVRGAGGSQGKIFVSMRGVTIVSTSTVTLGMGARNITAIPLSDINLVKVGNPNRVKICYTAIIGGKSVVETFTPLLVSAKRMKDLIMTVCDVAQNKTIKFTEEGGLLYQSSISLAKDDGEDDSDKDEACIDETSEDDFIVLHSPRSKSRIREIRSNII